MREQTSSASQKNLVVTQKAQVNPESTSENSPPPVENPELASNKYTESVLVTRPNVENKTENKSKPKKPLNSMWNFPYDPIFRRWYRDEPNIFKVTIEDLGLKSDNIDLEQLVIPLNIAAEIRNCSPTNKNDFYSILTNQYNIYFEDTPTNQRPTIEKFDNYLYHWAKKVWPHALDIIFEHCGLRNRAPQNS